MNEPTPSSRLLAHLAAGTLLRRKWHDTDAAGRERRCALAALVGRPINGVDECPAALMPRWLAHLVPWMDDAGTAAAWPDQMRRLAAVAARWHVLHDDDWRRLDYACRAVSVREARAHAPVGSDTLSAIDGGISPELAESA